MSVSLRQQAASYYSAMRGNLYALDTSNGQRLWRQKIGGPIGGGVITYIANGTQKVAVATVFTSVLWPMEIATGKMVALGLGEAAGK